MPSKTNFENSSAPGTDEWGGNKTRANQGTIVELKHGFVVVTGTLEAGKDIDGRPCFRVTTYDLNNNTQTQQEILMKKFFLKGGIKVDDRVEIQGRRNERGFIEAIAILDLDTSVKLGKLTYHRYWILLLALLLMIIGSAIHILLVIGIVCLVIFLIAKRKSKFLNEK